MDITIPVTIQTPARTDHGVFGPVDVSASRTDVTVTLHIDDATAAAMAQLLKPKRNTPKSSV